MNSKNNSVKIATDLSWILLTWSAWFLSIVFIVYLVLRMIGGDVEINQQALSQQSFLTFAYRPAKVYMLVIGIISISSFLPFFVKQGITRKDYFVGSAISSVIVSFILMTMAGIVAIVEKIFIPTRETASFLGPDASWFLIIAIFSLNILVYFMAGWLIGSGFYRFGGLGGMLYIVMAVVVVSISDILWEFELKNPIKNLLDFSSQWEIPFFISFLSTLLLIGIALITVRTTTKRIQIKMK